MPTLKAYDSTTSAGSFNTVSDKQNLNHLPVMAESKPHIAVQNNNDEEDDIYDEVMWF